MLISIRKATPDDVDSFVELGVMFTISNHEQGLVQGDADERLKERRALLYRTFQATGDNMRIIYLAALNQKSVGYALAVINEGNYGFLAELFVIKSARGQGVGRRLLERVIDWMKKREVTSLNTSVFIQNDESKTFFARAGFEPHAINYQRKL